MQSGVYEIEGVEKAIASMGYDAQVQVDPHLKRIYTFYEGGSNGKIRKYSPPRVWTPPRN